MYLGVVNVKVRDQYDRLHVHTSIHRSVTTSFILTCLPSVSDDSREVASATSSFLKVAQDAVQLGSLHTLLFSAERENTVTNNKHEVDMASYFQV